MFDNRDFGAAVYVPKLERPLTRSLGQGITPVQRLNAV
jgi:hypothetical protein